MQTTLVEESVIEMMTPKKWQTESQMSDPPRTFSLKNKIITKKIISSFLTLLCKTGEI
jgi:hypothetical protein